MNDIPAFNFPHNSLVEMSLFENDFTWPKFFWKFSENSQEKVHGLKKEPAHRCFLVNFLNIF